MINDQQSAFCILLLPIHPREREREREREKFWVKSSRVSVSTKLPSLKREGEKKNKAEKARRRERKKEENPAHRR